ncbi:hypothetical protein C8R46DRAFT_1046921 [Mycena filopes]|nr:hypothetical protein C8R46DRAFT_1046921 [Mycena filopes]
MSGLANRRAGPGSTCQEFWNRPHTAFPAFCQDFDQPWSSKSKFFVRNLTRHLGVFSLVLKRTAYLLVTDKLASVERMTAQSPLRSRQRQYCPSSLELYDTESSRLRLSKCRTVTRKRPNMSSLSIPESTDQTFEASNEHMNRLLNVANQQSTRLNTAIERLTKAVEAIKQQTPSTDTKTAFWTAYEDIQRAVYTHIGEGHHILIKRDTFCVEATHFHQCVAFEFRLLLSPTVTTQATRGRRPSPAPGRTVARRETDGIKGVQAPARKLWSRCERRAVRGEEWLPRRGVLRGNTFQDNVVHAIGMWCLQGGCGVYENSLADEFDKEFQRKHGNDLDTCLIFAGLFSAVSSAFIIQIQPEFQLHSNMATQSLLILALTRNITGTPLLEFQNSSLAATPTIVVIAQAFLFVSLFSTLLAALLAVLGKQWLLQYDSVGEKGTIGERALERQRKFDGIRRWKFDLVLQICPLLLQFSLFLFAAALSTYLWTIHHAIAGIVLVLTSLGFLSYAEMIRSAAASPDSPFQNSLSTLLMRLMQDSTGLSLRPIGGLGRAIMDTAPPRVQLFFSHCRINWLWLQLSSAPTRSLNIIQPLLPLNFEMSARHWCQWWQCHLPARPVSQQGGADGAPTKNQCAAYVEQRQRPTVAHITQWQRLPAGDITQRQRLEVPSTKVPSIRAGL